jgi:hypothetical protein
MNVVIVIQLFEFHKEHFVKNGEKVPKSEKSGKSAKIRRKYQNQKKIRRSEKIQKHVQISETFPTFQKICPP